jgi:hypothetical protein
VGHHAAPGRALDIVIVVSAAPAHAHVATWRFLAVRGRHVIHELVVALVGHHAPPGRALDVAIITVSRCCSRAFALAAIGALDEQTVRSIAATRRQLARDRRVQRLELRPQRAVAFLHLL